MSNKVYRSIVKHSFYIVFTKLSCKLMVFKHLVIFVANTPAIIDTITTPQYFDLTLPISVASLFLKNFSR